MSEVGESTSRDKSRFITGLRILGYLLPGDRLKTWFYLTFIYKPRKFFRDLLFSFYRMELPYAVRGEFKKTYAGRASILEFGVADGYSFNKILYAAHYLGLGDRVMVHGFDTFEGMPASQGEADEDVVSGDGWVESQFKGDYEALKEHCEKKYANFALHRGLFSDTLTDELIETLREHPPILIWMDADFYSSTKSVFERLAPHIPSGCVVYFDEYEFNFGSRYTGEARIVHEVNRGDWGEGIELVSDRDLSLNSQRVYRFINMKRSKVFNRLCPLNVEGELRRRSNGSPLP